MENATKAIIIAAAVVITLALVTIGFLVMRSGQDTAKTAISKVDKMNSEMADSEFLVYDETDISGSEVLNVINKYKNEVFGIEVKTNASSDYEDYIYDFNPDTTTGFATLGTTHLDTSAKLTIARDPDPTNDEYISPNVKFTGRVYRNEDTNEINGIQFTQKP